MQICKKSASSPTVTPLTLVVNGTDVITADTKTAQISLTTGTAATSIIAGRDLIPAGTTAYTWKLDATQFYIPLIKSDSASGRETYVKIQSKSTVDGSNGIKVQILASDGTMVDYDAGTIISGTPLTIAGSDLVAAAAAAGHPVDGVSGFAAIVTVNAAQGDVFAYANIIDPNGAKRVPVKTVGGTIVE